MPRILVVDGDAAIRESIRLVLDTAGINGIETIRALRARVPGLRVIVISGSLMHGGDAVDLKRMVAEIEGVTSLAKPFKLGELLDTVRANFPGLVPTRAIKLAG